MDHNVIKILCTGCNEFNNCKISSRVEYPLHKIGFAFFLKISKRKKHWCCQSIESLPWQNAVQELSTAPRLQNISSKQSGLQGQTWAECITSVHQLITRHYLLSVVIFRPHTRWRRTAVLSLSTVPIELTVRSGTETIADRLLSKSFRSLVDADASKLFLSPKC